VLIVWAFDLCCGCKFEGFDSGSGFHSPNRHVHTKKPYQGSLESACRPYQEGYLRQSILISCSSLSSELIDRVLTSILRLIFFVP